VKATHFTAGSISPDGAASSPASSGAIRQSRRFPTDGFAV
jgi:hypothetical protein